MKLHKQREDRVRNLEDVVLSDVRELEVEDDVLAVGLLAVQAHCEGVEEQRAGDRGDEVQRARRAERKRRGAPAQLVRTGEVEVAPGTRLGPVAELVVDLGEQMKGIP